MFSYYFILLFAVLSLAWSCSEPLPVAGESPAEVSGSGILITRDSHPGEFSNIHTSGPITTDVRAGDFGEVRITADHNVINRVLSEVHGDTLYLSLKEGQYHNIWVSVLVRMPRVRSLTNAGSGSMRVSNTFAVDPRILVNLGKGTLWLEGEGGCLYMQDAGKEAIEPGEDG